MASMKTTKLHIFTAHAIALLLLCLVPASSAKSFSDWLFPNRTVSLINESGGDVYYMCSFKNYENSFHLLPKGENMTFNFTQHLFPTRWCYLYLNDQNHGFFWAYAVRMRCDVCDWKIKSTGPFFYRSLLSQQWEIVYMHPLPNTIYYPDQQGSFHQDVKVVDSEKLPETTT